MDELRTQLLPIYGITDGGSNQQALEEWAYVNFLSPLHLEVILGNQDKVRELLSLGANPNAKDRRLWTPLHHAALFRDQILIELLLKNGADPNQLNDYQGTYQDILHLLTEPNQEKKEETPVYYQGVPLTKAEYFALTHSHYIEECYTEPKWLIELWRLPFSYKKQWDETEFLTKVKNEFHHFPSSYQKMPSEVIALASSLPKLPKAGLGGFAKRRYLPFEPVGEYLGKIEPAKSNYAFTFEKISEGKLVINALNYSNALSRINDGFPNSVVIMMRNSRGLPCRYLLLTLEIIEPGMQFCFDYGPHVIKNGPYIEVRKKELREFIVNKAIDEWRECLQKGDSFQSYELSLSDLVFMAKFKYILHTPSVVFTSILDRTISAERGQEIFNLAVSYHMIKTEDPKFFHSIIPTAIRWLEALDAVGRVQAEMMTREVLTWIEQKPFRVAVLMIHKACKRLKKETWEKVKKRLTENYFTSIS